MVEKLREDVKDELERVIGTSQDDILKSEVSTNAESEMGRFVADSQLWAAQTKDKDIKIIGTYLVKKDDSTASLGSNKIPLKSSRKMNFCIDKGKSLW